MKQYLTYDIQGIQNFIFQIPRIRYIVGGSALIDFFDHETVRELAKQSSGIECVYAAGGKGSFECNSKEAALAFQERLIKEAHRVGLSIRFGLSEDFSEAALNAKDLYSYVPQELEGEPCNVSGLYPASKGKAEHDSVRLRIYDRFAPKEERKIFRRFEKHLLEKLNFEEFDKENVDFFHDIHIKDSQGGNEKHKQDAIAGARALGNRNRWAVICMDGNDMGMQFRAQKERLKASEMQDWIREMSGALHECTHEATRRAIEHVFSLWKNSKDYEYFQDKDSLTLPIRPLLVGGDDIVVLCHVAYAFAFAKTVMHSFTELSEKKHAKSKKGLWNATDGSLTISAGIAFCPVSLPLHVSVNYAELLLASAKSLGRAQFEEGSPSPACIDWESITESLIDTPHARRQREMLFLDTSLEPPLRVKLTERPYLLSDFEELEERAESYRSLPGTIRHQILPAMRQGRSDRLAFLATLKKRHPGLFKELAKDLCNVREFKKEKDGQTASTQVIDALLILEEKMRMQKETVDA